MDLLFPLVVATEVYHFLDYESLALVVRATRSVQQVYEPVALQLVRVGHMRVRLHRTSLVHKLWKLWRRSVALLEECLVSASMARGGVYFTLETAKYRLWSPRHQSTARTPMVAFMDLLLIWGLDVWTSHCLRPDPLRTGASQHLGVDRLGRRVAGLCGGSPAQGPASPGTHTDLMPVRVCKTGGADRPKGRESRRTGSVVRCRNKSCSYGICPPQRKYLIFVCTIFLTVKVSMTWAYTIVSDNLD